MTNLEIIKQLRERIFTDEDGEQYSLEFLPPLTNNELDNLKSKFPNHHIAEELLEIMSMTKGWDGYGLEQVYFDSIGSFGFFELSPHSICMGHDGFGNYWVLDINKRGTLGKVFFVCHDPAVLIIHSQNLNEYLHHLLEFYENPDEGYLNEIHEKVVRTVWKENPNVSSKSEFLQSNPSYSKFLSPFEGGEWAVADLRKGDNKEGFAWGKYDSNQYTVRHNEDLVWVLKNKKKGFFNRLFG